MNKKNNSICKKLYAEALTDFKNNFDTYFHIVKNIKLDKDYKTVISAFQNHRDEKLKDLEYNPIDDNREKMSDEDIKKEEENIKKQCENKIKNLEKTYNLLQLDISDLSQAKAKNKIKTIYINNKKVAVYSVKKNGEQEKINNKLIDYIYNKLK